MKEDDWIEWHGGDCPVPEDTWVSVRFRKSEKEPCNEAGCWQWKHYGLDFDIVAYRIDKPVEPPKPDTSAEDALWREYAGKALLLQERLRFSGAPVIAVFAADIADAMIAEAKKRGRV